ncbi:MAG: hypothetical protein KatS3mg023_1985 [Armatimonadota bacterium]|nr:MAG: hypothetical protein KatS3mg023_1985 [Armatimonadota bacterium]
MKRDDLLAAALHYRQAGFSVVPVRADGSKAPAVTSWKRYQSELPTEADLRQWFDNGHVLGVAVVAGKVSGNLAVMDFDDPTAWDWFFTLLHEHDPDLLYSLPCAETPSGGTHLYFRTDEPLPTQVLARDEEGNTMIEIRGEGSYAIVPPSPAPVHPEGKPYRMIRHALTDAPQLTAEQVEDLLSIARSLDRKKPEPAPLRVTGEAQRVGDRFNQEGDVLNLLQQHGWRVAGNGREGNIYLTRPGKARGVSASWHPQLGTLYVFSTNAPPFEAGRAYSAFAVYTLLEHGGDFSAAAKALAQQYGNGHDSVVPQPAPRRAISLRELMAKEFEPLTYLVPNILPEGGLTLLVGRPKVGKSWFALQIACALSAGGFALGLDTPLPKRRVLYCALEDGLRRLQRRITLLGTAYDPDAFHIVTELSPLDRGGADELRQLIRETQAEVVFVDVVARILPRRRRNDGVYQSDYDAFSLLKDLAVAEGATVVAVHHENKAPNEDPLMRVSGSTGLTGAVDAVLTLSKPRGELTGTLFVTGRDVEYEGEWAITFTAGRWYIEGDAATVRMSEQRQAILRAISELGGKATPKQIADYLGKNASTTRTLLAKMKAAGELLYDGTRYSINTVDTVDSVDSTSINTTVDSVDSVDSNQAQVSTLSTLSTASTPSTLSTLSTPLCSTQQQQDGVCPDDGVPDYRTAVIPLRDGVAAWCDVCGCSMLHTPTREGDWECVGCNTRRQFPSSAVDIEHTNLTDGKPTHEEVTR